VQSGDKRNTQNEMSSLLRRKRRYCLICEPQI